MIEYWWGCDDGDMRFWGRGMCGYGAYGPAALPVPVDCANAHLCCKVMETCGCLGAVACVDAAHMGRLHCKY